MTKKQYIAHKREWAAMVNDNRVLRIGETTFKGYQTRDRCERAYAEMLADGFDVRRVPPQINL